MALVSVETQGSIAIVRMQNGENRFTLEFFSQFLAALDEVESNKDINVLITTGDGKFYSNGVDLERVQYYTEKELEEFGEKIQLLYKRILTYPMVTIAAINGHVYAGGAILALSHDYRVMKKERGWFRLPEIELRRPFPVGLLEMIKVKVPQSEFINCIVMGKKYTAEEGKSAGIIHKVCSGDQLLKITSELAENASQQNFDRTIMAQIKNDLYFLAVQALCEHARYYAKL